MPKKEGGPGMRLFPAAKRLKISYPWLCKAVEKEQVKTIVFGNARLIPNAEIRRLEEEWYGEEEEDSSAA
ncbi:hypothetical protein I6F07_32000 [Ensifer sp. IC4062]|nr:hypothetical protein [Ensifer sp. IC4062]MCA1444711.1 hypothetical protein [Ensifer sp. IC4062]